MTDENDGAAWSVNPLEAFQQASEQATRQQQQFVQSLLAGESAGNGFGSQLDAVSRTATFKTRVQSGGRISIPDAEREALDIEEGDIVQTIVVPVKRNRE